MKAHLVPPPDIDSACVLVLTAETDAEKDFLADAYEKNLLAFKQKLDKTEVWLMVMPND